MTTAVTTGMYVDPGRSQIMVGDWAQRSVETKVNLKPSMHARYEGLLRVSVLPRWKNVKLVDVTHEGVAAWVASLTRKGLAPRHRPSGAPRLLADAHAGRPRRTLGTQPRRPRPAAPTVKREKTFLTMDQVDELADAADDCRTAILFLAYTGVHFGELSGLRLRRLDLMRRRAEIVEAVAEVGGRPCSVRRSPTRFAACRSSASSSTTWRS